ncbi:hypothetical protein OROMI_001825 [Orobanche minor]
MGAVCLALNGYIKRSPLNRSEVKVVWQKKIHPLNGDKRLSAIKRSGYPLTIQRLLRTLVADGFISFISPSHRFG